LAVAVRGHAERLFMYPPPGTAPRIGDAQHLVGQRNGEVLGRPVLDEQ
jgi:hypothetical protein